MPSFGDPNHKRFWPLLEALLTLLAELFFRGPRRVIEVDLESASLDKMTLNKHLELTKQIDAFETKIRTSRSSFSEKKVREYFPSLVSGLEAGQGHIDTMATLRTLVKKKSEQLDNTPGSSNYKDNRTIVYFKWLLEFHSYLKSLKDLFETRIHKHLRQFFRHSPYSESPAVASSSSMSAWHHDLRPPVDNLYSNFKQVGSGRCQNELVGPGLASVTDSLKLGFERWTWRVGQLGAMPEKSGSLARRPNFSRLPAVRFWFEHWRLDTNDGCVFTHFRHFSNSCQKRWTNRRSLKRLRV